LDDRPIGHRSQCGCDTWKQATSYCDTEFGFFEFWGWLPAYLPPAVPPELVADGSLNGAPGERLACPGLAGSA
jgi:hypothetical protein